MRFTVRTGTARHKMVMRGVPSAPPVRPFVTVVIPTYNYGRFLGSCVDSVLTQRDVELKLLIMDDCSTDDTPEVAEKLAQCDDRVSVIRSERNRGMISTMNHAFELVDSEYVVKLDADDLLPPGSLARSTALLQTHPKVGFVYGRPHHFDGDIPKLPDSSTRSWTIWPGVDWLTARCESSANVISQPEVVMRTSVLRRCGEVREDLPHTSDFHLWLQLASMGSVGRVNGPAQGLYRVHEGSLQRTIHSGYMMDLLGRRAAFDAVFAGEARHVPRAEELLATAHRSLASAALDIACRAYDRGRTDWPVDDLVAFAMETDPQAKKLKEWAALEHRRRVGAARAKRHPQFVADALTRRMSEELGRWYWLRTGAL